MEIIEPLLPKRKKTCPPKWTKREILDGILYQLKQGSNWADLPKDLPPYSTLSSLRSSLVSFLVVSVVFVVLPITSLSRLLLPRLLSLLGWVVPSLL
ncbi:transposase [Pseudanabaena minima]|uniref:transposase n=1 Tax=Pseudanabaena minima TaxID=890415 RepID=UPI003DA8FCE1